MTVLFACNEQEGFVTVGAPDFSTSLTNHDPAFTNGALGLKEQGTETLTGDFTATADIWFHALINMASTFSASGSIVRLRKGSVQIVRIRAIGTNPGTLNFEYWNGSAWIIIAAAIAAVDVLQDIDIHCKIAASGGQFTLYQNGNQIAEFTGDTTLSGANNVDNFILGGSFSRSYFSQLLVKDSNTIGDKVQTSQPTADGALTAWSGSFADIDDAGLNEDGTLVGSSIADDESSYVIDDPVAIGGKSIEAVVHVARASRDATGPQNLQLTTISGGTSYPSSSFALELGLAPYQNIRSVDPDTSAPWTIAGASNALMGVKAKA